MAVQYNALFCIHYGAQLNMPNYLAKINFLEKKVMKRFRESYSKFYKKVSKRFLLSQPKILWPVFNNHGTILFCQSILVWHSKWLFHILIISTVWKLLKLTDLSELRLKHENVWQTKISQQFWENNLLFFSISFCVWWLLVSEE